jgi:hypothetical protein
MFNIKDLINLIKINETKKKLINLQAKKKLNKFQAKKKMMPKFKKVLKAKKNKIIKIVKRKNNKVLKILTFKKKKLTKLEMSHKKHREMVNKMAKKYVNYNANRDKIGKKSVIFNTKNAKKPPKSNVDVLVIACEYHGTPFPLSGCYNDANKFVHWVTSIYPKANLVYLTDNPAIHSYDPTVAEDAPNRYPSFDSTTFPTHDIVYEAIKKLIKSKSKLKFLYMSGHGATANDVPAPIESTLMDINSAGNILNTITFL